MEFEELSIEALIANMQYHQALAQRAMNEAKFNIERAELYEKELKRRGHKVE